MITYVIIACSISAVLAITSLVIAINIVGKLEKEIKREMKIDATFARNHTNNKIEKIEEYLNFIKNNTDGYYFEYTYDLNTGFNTLCVFADEISIRLNKVYISNRNLQCKIVDKENRVIETHERMKTNDVKEKPRYYQIIKCSSGEYKAIDVTNIYCEHKNKGV